MSLVKHSSEGLLAKRVSELNAAVTKLVANEVAKVVASAPQDLDTLKEIADYIASDKTGAAEMANKIAENSAAIEELKKKPSVEVVAPSADGAGKAADAKAVYDEYRRKDDLEYTRGGNGRFPSWTFVINETDQGVSYPVIVSHIENKGDIAFYAGRNVDFESSITYNEEYLGDSVWNINFSLTLKSGRIVSYTGITRKPLGNLSLIFDNIRVSGYESQAMTDSLQLAGDCVKQIDELRSQVPAMIFDDVPYGAAYPTGSVELKANGLYLLKNCTAYLPSPSPLGKPITFVVYCRSLEEVEFRDRNGRTILCNTSGSLFSSGAATAADLAIPKEKFIAVTVRVIMSDKGVQMLHLEV